MAPPHHALRVTASMAALRVTLEVPIPFSSRLKNGFSPRGDNMRQRGPPSLLQWPPLQEIQMTRNVPFEKICTNKQKGTEMPYFSVVFWQDFYGFLPPDRHFIHQNNKSKWL